MTSACCKESHTKPTVGWREKREGERNLDFNTLLIPL
jgi:hypothetical protein